MSVIADISVSLDGYATAPGADIEHGLGVDGEALHNWVFNGDDVDTDVLAVATSRSGAVVMGRTLFDVVDGPHGWNDEMGYGAHHAAAPAFFVVTHRGRPDHGGGSIIRQCVLDGHVDELHLHVSPIVFGGGTPLFVDGDRVQLRQLDVRPSATAIHVTYVRA